MKLVKLKNKQPIRLYSRQGGFSLLELLLYIGLASSILLVSSSFFVLTIKSKVRNQTIADVEQQGVRVMQIINQKIHNATILTSPNQGALADTLNLNNGAIIFDLLANTIRINEGVLVDLTSDKVLVSDLSFYNLSYVDTPGIIRTQFTLTHYNSSARNEYDYSKTFYGSANLRAN